MSHFARISPADPSVRPVAAPADAVAASLSVLADIGRLAGGGWGETTEQPSVPLARRFAAAGSLAQSSALRIADDAERMAAAGLRTLIAAHPGSPPAQAAARLLAAAIAAAFARIDALLPQSAAA